MPEFDDIIKNVLEDTKSDVTGHSEYQIRNFIIGPQPTDYGKYKQCILELKSRIRNYQNLLVAIDNLKKQEVSSTNIKQISECEILIEDIKREIYIFNDIFEGLKSKIDLTKKDELEAHYWDTKFNRELVLHMSIGAPIPVGLAQNILSLPNESVAKIQFLKLVHSRIDISKKDQIENNGQSERNLIQQ